MKVCQKRRNIPNSQPPSPTCLVGVQGVGFRVQGAEGVQGFGFRAWGFGLRGWRAYGIRKLLHLHCFFFDCNRITYPKFWPHGGGPCWGGGEGGPRAKDSSILGVLEGGRRGGVG